jgi:hypothetical protein
MEKKESIINIWEKIISLASEKNLILFDGHTANDEKIPIIICNYKNSSDLKNFIDLSISCETSCLVYNTYVLSAEEIEEALEILSEEESENSELEKELKLALKNPNQLSYINLKFLAKNSSAIYSLEVLSEAHRFVSELNNEAEDEYDDDDDGDLFENADDDEDFEDDNEFGQESLEENEKISVYATKLASLENFGEVYKSNDNIQLLLERLMKAENKSSGENKILSFYEKDFIRRRAKAIYETDILPDVEIKLRERANILIKEGMKKTEIATTLGMTLPKLNKLLSNF